MNILVLGGTRMMGKHLVKSLIEDGHEVTIATRGITKDDFGSEIKRIFVDRTNGDDMKRAFSYKYYDVVYDSLAYCAGHVKTVLDAVRCRRYIMISSTAVYRLHFQTTETDFVPEKENIVWYEDRVCAPYDVLKKSAETALVNAYPQQNAVFVRFPYVIGEDDYTKRLYFYVQHVVSGVPMFVDNMDSQMGFISSGEAGGFLAFLAGDEITGAVNGASHGTVSVREIITYVEKKTEKRAVFSETGDAAPYNGTPGYSISTERAERIGYQFSRLKDWLYDLLDCCILTAEKEK